MIEPIPSAGQGSRVPSDRRSWPRSALGPQIGENDFFEKQAHAGKACRTAPPIRLAHDEP